ncbi:hypothetical protein ACFLV3_06515 [Chloroflexota bacterium]
MQRNSYRKAAVAAALVLAVGVSLWFSAPTRAFDITVSPPADGTLGNSHSLTATITLADTENLPVQSVNLYIYNASARTTYEATSANLPLNTTATPYTSIVASGSSAYCGTISTTAVATWVYGYGYGYGVWEGTPQSFGYGYGYGYGGGATTSITYTITWTSPTAWPSATYVAEIQLTADSTTFTSTSTTFALASGEAVGGGAGSPNPAPPPPTVVPVITIITEDGEFTSQVMITSTDGEVEIDIDEGTIGLTAEGDPINQITVWTREDAPLTPPDSHILGVAYDLGPDGATFAPPITMTFTYDPAKLPAGVAEEDLTVAFWDGSEWIELLGTVDPASNTITVEISHFTLFTILYPYPVEVIAPTSSPTPTTTPTPTPTPTPTATPTPTPTPTPAPTPTPTAPAPTNWWPLIGVIIGVVVAAAVTWFLMRRRAA